MWGFSMLERMRGVPRRNVNLPSGSRPEYHTLTDKGHTSSVYSIAVLERQVTT